MNKLLNDKLIIDAWDKKLRERCMKTLEEEMEETSLFLQSYGVKIIENE